jgi:response regulator RpfG family c-di-GMP phosphodiesterase
MIRLAAVRRAAGRLPERQVPGRVGAGSRVKGVSRQNDEQMSPIRVVLVDDHPVVLGGLRALLDSLPDFEVVGTATDGEAGVPHVVLTKPDAVLMDIRMPGIDGPEATRRIRESASGVAELALAPQRACC